jgi:two-component system cell cycle sensor histidine kinase/response regulator CckA
MRARVKTSHGSVSVEVERVGAHDDLLLWRFPQPPAPAPISVAAKWLSGPPAKSLALRDVLPLWSMKRVPRAANRLFRERAIDGDGEPAGQRFGNLVDVGRRGQVRLIAEGEPTGHAPRPCAGRSEEGRQGRHLPAVRAREGSGVRRRAPPGLARRASDRPRAGRSRRPLPDDEQAFRGAADHGQRTRLSGDLVVKEDKAAVADAVRRNARGPAMSGDLRSAWHGSREPVR